MIIPWCHPRFFAVEQVLLFSIQFNTGFIRIMSGSQRLNCTCLQFTIMVNTYIQINKLTKSVIYDTHGYEKIIEIKAKINLHTKGKWDNNAIIDHTNRFTIYNPWYMSI